MQFKPLFNNVLVERLEEENKTVGGIIIPDNAKEKPATGKVVALGDGKVLENGNLLKPTVKVGDMVMFKKWGGSETKIDGKDFIIMPEDEIIGILS